ncbi:16S rRNA (cytosine967-C5)-methyltransferase [Friedmanniella endophytica]|uniref:16S rRNA (Cytosine967-C5)-methyltransferase n=1 Tax=Microlunatus kandeliicorticis TaxID=1759536 RepID=A0A7W3P6I1_9ACTN|nr:transcription antitermination factor NusB [Microlunatus kandeliicorticis]MBA8795076.1 16S rRNA (cytosine967-C5)-methyltransferase [Microlunatus kandeliicorticis]
MSPDRRRRRPDPARRAAFDTLRAVHADDAYANLALAQQLGRHRLTGRDAAFATELLAGTCRAEGTYDAVITAAAGRPTGSLQPAVLDLLRLGTHQLLAMRVPSHAAVAATVDLAAGTVGPRVTGLVNAVLRKVAARDLDGWLDVVTTGLDPADARALRTAHPRWIVEALGDRLTGQGRTDELDALLAADNVAPRVALAVRPGLAEVAELTAAGASPGRWSPYAAGWDGRPDDLAAVREGRAGVQDEGSQLAALALARVDAPAGPWLDACAGPGGKSALLAGLSAGADERLVAAEISPHRAALVARALAGYRTDTTRAAVRPAVLIADGTAPAWRPRSFARVLADVPCTGLGALRRRPESRWRRRPDDLETLVPLQHALFDAAVEALAPGGVLAYVTCSPHRAETVEVVAAGLTRHSDLTAIEVAPLLPELDGTRAEDGDQLQLWPHRHGTDAMFVALLRRA